MKTTIRIFLAASSILGLLHFGFLLGAPNTEASVWYLGGQTARVLLGIVYVGWIVIAVLGFKKIDEDGIGQLLGKKWFPVAFMVLCASFIFSFFWVFLLFGVEDFLLVRATRTLYLLLYPFNLVWLVYSGLAVGALAWVKFIDIREKVSLGAALETAAKTILLLVLCAYLVMLLVGWLGKSGVFERWYFI